MKKWNAPAIEELELDMTASFSEDGEHECTTLFGLACWESGWKHSPKYHGPSSDN